MTSRRKRVDACDFPACIQPVLSGEGWAGRFCKKHDKLRREVGKKLTREIQAHPYEERWMIQNVKYAILKPEGRK